MLTADRRLRYQQNISKYDIGIVVIETIDTTLPNLRRLLPKIRDAISAAKPAAVIVIEET